MTFVFRAIAMAAICFSGGIAVAAQPYGPGQPQGPMNGTVPPYVSSVSSPAAQMAQSKVLGMRERPKSLKCQAVQQLMEHPARLTIQFTANRS